MLLLITSQWPEQEWLFFFEGSAKRCFDTTLRLGNQGCLTVLARIQVAWLFFLKNPVLTISNIDDQLTIANMCHEYHQYVIFSFCNLLMRLMNIELSL